MIIFQIAFNLNLKNYLKLWLGGVLYEGQLDILLLFLETTKQHEICMKFWNTKRSTQKQPHKNIVNISNVSFNLLAVEWFRSGQADQEQACPES